MTLSSGSRNSRLATVSTRQVAALSTILAATDSFSFSSSLAPKNLAEVRLNPVESPCMKPSTTVFIEDVAPTAASAFSPRYCPTILVSARL